VPVPRRNTRAVVVLRSRGQSTRTISLFRFSKGKLKTSGRVSDIWWEYGRLRSDCGVDFLSSFGCRNFCLFLIVQN
jgi:hypothetical protein